MFLKDIEEQKELKDIQERKKSKISNHKIKPLRNINTKNRHSMLPYFDIYNTSESKSALKPSEHSKSKSKSESKDKNKSSESSILKKNLHRNFTQGRSEKRSILKKNLSKTMNFQTRVVIYSLSHFC